MKKNDSSTNDNVIKEILNKIMIALYIIIALLLVNIVVNVRGVTTYSYGSTQHGSSENNDSEEIPEYDVSKYEAIDYAGLKKVMKDKKTSVVYIGRESCGYCSMFIPIMNQAQEEYNFTTYYFDITQVFNYSTNSIVDQKAYDDLSEYNDFFKENFLATPMVVVFKDGKYVGGTMGYQDYETYSAFLEKNGISKK